ncbi:MAG: TonB-dependent outer rane transport protein [Gemmatimonadetes bacterium]|nr:TonB-dependent outer rane transport protein [Gemmatimonadota bacterium]
MRLHSFVREAGRLGSVAVLSGATALTAQEPSRDSARVAPATAALPGVRVTATREGPRVPLELPYAVTLTRPDSLAALRRLGVDELLFAVPGVALANRQNPAQDPRVSIRGFGARSAFGVRGVRVLQDGVPVTLPDGQTPVDVIDVEGADRVEVVRGSASSLYGNAAGGVIDVRSKSPSLAAVSPYARVVGGGSVPTMSAAGAGGTLGPLGYTSSVTRIVGRGYRDYSDQRATRAALRLLHTPTAGGTSPSVVLAARFNDVSHAESPGALTRAQLDADPRMADPLSVRKQAGKIVRQGDLALTVAQQLASRVALDATVYGSVRTLANPLTFSVVNVGRTSGGVSARLSGSGALRSHAVRFAGGGDLQWQNDDRQEYEACIDAVAPSATCPVARTQRGALRKDQRELVSSAGPFVRGEVALAPTLLASAGVRADAITFRVRDRLVSATNPDDSGDRTLHAVSPATGLVWRVAPLASLYTTVSTSFETPTTTELGNKPDGSAGINPDLKPQRTLSLEIGGKGVLPGTALRWELAAFDTRARDELVPFDIPGGAGRRYFRNAGRTRRRGAELGADAEYGPLTVRSAYSISRFRYVDYSVGTTSYAGKRIPGVPEHALMAAAAVRRGVFTLSGTADVASAVDVDDANSAQAPGRTILGLALSNTLRVGAVQLASLVALQNLADVRSVGSVSVNATGGKFYEPAPGRTLLVRFALARDASDSP